MLVSGAHRGCRGVRRRTAHARERAALAVHGHVSCSPGTLLTPGQIAWRTALAIVFITFSMLGVAAMALFLSTLTDSPQTATLGALGLPHRSSLLLTIDAARPLQPYLPTRYWLTFVDLYRDPLLLSGVERGSGCRPSTLPCSSELRGPTSPPRTSRAESGAV